MMLRRAWRLTVSNILASGPAGMSNRIFVSAARHGLHSNDKTVRMYAGEREIPPDSNRPGLRAFPAVRWAVEFIFRPIRQDVRAPISTHRPAPGA